VNQQRWSQADEGSAFLITTARSIPPAIIAVGVIGGSQWTKGAGCRDIRVFFQDNPEITTAATPIKARSQPTRHRQKPPGNQRHNGHLGGENKGVVMRSYARDPVMVGEAYCPAHAPTDEHG
jgi:hypothetical protein